MHRFFIRTMHSLHANKAMIPLCTLAVSKSADLVGIFAPVLLDFHAKVKPDAAAEQLLKVGARLGTDLLDGVSLLSDDYAFLAITFNVDVREDAIEIFLAFVFKLFALYAYGMGNLFIERS